MTASRGTKWGRLGAWLWVLLVTAGASGAVPRKPPSRALDPGVLKVDRPWQEQLLLRPQSPPPAAVPSAAPSTKAPEPGLPPPPQATPAPPSEWTALEQWVSGELAAKRVADLAQQSTRDLSARFVTALLEGGKGVGPTPSGVRIANANVVGDVLLSAPVVASCVTFEKVTFQGDFSAQEAVFPGALKLVGSTVKGQLKLDAARVGGALELQESTFLERVSASARIEGALFLDRSRFEDGFDAKNASVGGSVQAFDTRFACASQCESALGLSGARIARDLFLSRARVVGPLRADRLTVDGNLVLERPKLTASADFTSGSVGQYLVLELPDLPRALRISQLRYGGISNGEANYDAQSTWRDLKRLFASCEYSADIYAHLEEFFEDSGEAALADDVYVERKLQERQKLSGRAWLLSWLTYFTIGYGRHPAWAFIWGALFVAIGRVVFRDEQAMAQSEAKPGAKYRPFWYSLDLFLPLTRLQAAERWVPLPERRWAWLYLRLHVLLGWILVPLGIAAVSGLIH